MGFPHYTDIGTVITLASARGCLFPDGSEDPRAEARPNCGTVDRKPRCRESGHLVHDSDRRPRSGWGVDPAGLRRAFRGLERLLHHSPDDREAQIGRRFVANLL